MTRPEEYNALSEATDSAPQGKTAAWFAEKNPKNFDDLRSVASEMETRVRLLFGETLSEEVLSQMMKSPDGVVAFSKSSAARSAQTVINVAKAFGGDITDSVLTHLAGEIVVQNGENVYEKAQRKIERQKISISGEGADIALVEETQSLGSSIAIMRTRLEANASAVQLSPHQQSELAISDIPLIASLSVRIKSKYDEATLGVLRQGKGNRFLSRLRPPAQ